MGLVHGAGEETVLPDVPRLAAAQIQPTRVIHVGSAQALGQRSFSRRNRNHVDVVTHQTIAHHSDRATAAVVREQLEVQAAALVIEKDGLAAVAALRDVMAKAGNHRARHSCHDEFLVDSARQVSHTVSGFRSLSPFSYPLFIGALGSLAAMGTWQDWATPRTLDHGILAVITVFSRAAGTA